MSEQRCQEKPASQEADYEARRAEFLRAQPTYQRYDAMVLVRQAAAMLAEPGDLVIYRDAFRWHDHKDESVLSNHYESMSLQSLAEDFGYEIVHDFKHVAVVRARKVTAPPPAPCYCYGEAGDNKHCPQHGGAL